MSATHAQSLARPAQPAAAAEVVPATSRLFNSARALTEYRAAATYRAEQLKRVPSPSEKDRLLVGRDCPVRPRRLHT
jgi:hypothetical protein